MVGMKNIYHSCGCISTLVAGRLADVFQCGTHPYTPDADLSELARLLGGH
jgi:hypothetical protein